MFVADIVDLLKLLLGDRAKDHVLRRSVQPKSVKMLIDGCLERAGTTILETINTHQPIPGIIYRFGRGTLVKRLGGGGSNVNTALMVGHRSNSR